MTKDTVNSLSTCIGIDLGDRRSQVAVLDRATGEILREESIPSTRCAFEHRFKNQEPARVALEVGTHSRWISECLVEAGHEVIIADARRLPLITRSNKKSDRTDAECLARLASADPTLLHPLKHRSRGAQADRTILIARDRLVGCRTKLINCIRGTVKTTGDRLASCHSSVFHKRVRAELPEELRAALDPLLDTLAYLQQRIRDYNKLIKDKIENEYPVTQQLMKVGGVGPITSLNFVLTIDDPRRFSSSRAVGSYVGLRPKSRSSGKSEPELRISKSGDRMLRCHLVQSAQYILGHFGRDCDLRRWGLMIAGRGGKNAKKRAVVAVARKLSVLLHRLWITGEEYEPLRNAEKICDAAPRASSG